MAEESQEELRLRIAELERQLAAQEVEIERTVTAFHAGSDLTARMHALSRFTTGAVSRWNKDLVVEKIQEWAELYGEPPTAMEWNPAQAKARGREDVIANFAAGDWPHTSRVQRLFGGKWNDAIAAAGYEPMTAEDAYARRMKPQGANSDRWPEWTGWRIASVYRQRAGLSQAEVATKANLSVGWISNMETGTDTNVSIRALLAYTNALGLPPLALIEG